MERETYVHLELFGSANEVNAFVEGFSIASGQQGVYSAARENIKTDGFFEGLVSRVTHFVVTSDLIGPLSEAIEVATMVEIRIDNVNEIDHAELKFEFKCFSEEDGDAIRNVIEADLPAGVVLEGYEPKETKHENARGAEMYSPVHEFVITGRGQYHGPVEGIIELGRRLDDQDFIHPGRITLV